MRRGRRPLQSSWHKVSLIFGTVLDLGLAAKTAAFCLTLHDMPHWNELYAMAAATALCSAPAAANASAGGVLRHPPPNPVLSK